MKRTLMFLTVIVTLLLPATARAEKWLVSVSNSKDRILGKMDGEIFVTCEGKRRLNRADYYPQLKLEDAPDMYCQRRGYLDSVTGDDDSVNQAAEEENQHLDKILSEYERLEPQSEQESPNPPSQ